MAYDIEKNEQNLLLVEQAKAIDEGEFGVGVVELRQGENIVLVSRRDALALANHFGLLPIFSK